MPSAPRCVALVGPYLSGKTTLLEALLFASGTTGRRGSVREGNSVGDHAAGVRDVLAALQGVSDRPLVLRQVPLRGPEAEITGYVDLVSERAYSYRPGQASDLIPLPDDFWDREGETRTSLVEKLADFDDAL